MKRLFNVLLLIAILCFSACITPQETDPIAFGKDQCAYCRMTISNPQFGAELITDKGRVLKYDAAECLVNHLNNGAPAYQKLYAVPYDKQKKLRAVEELHFLISPDFRSPMGANLAAFSDTNNVDEKYHPQLMDWSTLLQKLKQ